MQGATVNTQRQACRRRTTAYWHQSARRLKLRATAAKARPRGLNRVMPDYVLKNHHCTSDRVLEPIRKTLRGRRRHCLRLPHNTSPPGFLWPVRQDVRAPGPQDVTTHNACWRSWTHDCALASAAPRGLPLAVSVVEPRPQRGRSPAAPWRLAARPGSMVRMTAH